MIDQNEPEKQDLHSMDITEEQKLKLKQFFPHVFNEDRIDFEKLRQTLGDEVDAGLERYGMTWPGKAECMGIIQQPSIATLKPCKEESVNFDDTENLFIEGDNLEVLKLLQKSYYGKVKMIYIDPPYNTGKEFIYPDKYSETLDTYFAYTGQVDDKGIKFSTNTDTDGRYHSKWLNMMYPRLFLARNLLRDDGVIFISIDDHEVTNLRKICDETFGENNFVANIVWQKKYAATNDAKGFSVMHDHILAYKKSDLFDRKLLPRTEEQNKPYKHNDNDGKGLWRSDNLLVKSFSPSGVFPIKNPNSKKEYYPPEGSCWRANQNTVNKWLEEGRIFFGMNGGGAPQLKRYLNEVQPGRVPVTWWPFTEVGHNDAANKELKALFNSKAPFDTPKPTSLINQMLRISINSDDVILDFFAGSCTTAHAVMQLNAEDDGNRKFIMVQLPEPCDEKSEAYKAGYKNIAEIGKERIRRVIKKIEDEQKQNSAQTILTDESTEKHKLDLGFKVFKLDKSNFNIWDGAIEDDTTGEEITKQLKLIIENIDPYSSEEDILYEFLLKSGFQLTTSVNEIELAGKKVYSIENDALLICLDRELNNEVITEMAKKEPARVICLDEGFSGNDQLKTNAVQIMKSFDVEDFRTV